MPIAALACDKRPRTVDSRGYVSKRLILNHEPVEYKILLIQGMYVVAMRTAGSGARNEWSYSKGLCLRGNVKFRQR